MKHINLKEVQTGLPADGNGRFYVDGKRISGVEFRRIKAEAVKLDCFSNSQVNGVWTFYCVARVN